MPTLLSRSAATTPVAGTDLVYVVQDPSGTPTEGKLPIADLTAGRSVSALNLVLTGATIPTNGLYLPAANTVGIATNGTLRVSVSTTALSSSLNTIIGSTSVAPDGTLHVHTASAGTVTADTDADDLVVENSAAGGISILVPNANNANLYFGSPTLNGGAFLQHNYNNSTFRIGTAKAGSTVTLAVGANVTNLTLSGAAGSELATFAGNVTLSEGKLTITDTANEIAFDVTSSATTTSAAKLTASAVTTGAAMEVVASGLTTGQGLYVYSNSADTNGRTLGLFLNDNTAATGAVCLTLRQDAANAFGNLVGTAGANVTDPISTFVTVPGTLAGWAQWDVNGAKRWIPFYNDPVS